MYYNVRQMLADIYSRIADIQAHREVLTQLLTDAIPLVSDIRQKLSNFLNHVLIFSNSIDIPDTLNSSEPNNQELISKLNRFANVTVPEFLADPMFNETYNQKYGNLYSFISNSTVYSTIAFIQAMQYDVNASLLGLNYALSQSDYTSALRYATTIKARISPFITQYSSTYASFLDVVVGTSVNSIITKYTIVQIICVFIQLAIALFVTPLSIIMWLLTVSRLSFLTDVLGIFMVVIFDSIILGLFNQLLRLIYGSNVHGYVMTYYNHITTEWPSNEQLDVLKYVDIITSYNYSSDEV
jgi:hypothetical protein